MAGQKGPTGSLSLINMTPKEIEQISNVKDQARQVTIELKKANQELRMMEKQAAKIDKVMNLPKGYTNPYSVEIVKRIERLREMEVTAERAVYHEKRLAKAQEDRKVKVLTTLAQASALENMSKGNFSVGDIAVLASGDKASAMIQSIAGKLGASDAFKTKLTGAIANLPIYGQLLSIIHENAQKLVGRAKGRDRAWTLNPGGYEFNRQIANARESGELSSIEAQRIATLGGRSLRGDEGEWSNFSEKFQNPFYSSMDQARDAVAGTKKMGDILRRPLTDPLEALSPTFARMQSSMGRKDVLTHNFEERKAAIERAFRKRTAVGPGMPGYEELVRPTAQTQQFADTFVKESQKAYYRELALREQKYGQLTGQDYEESANLAMQSTTDLTVQKGGMTNEEAGWFGRNYTKEIENANIRTAPQARPSRYQQMKIDREAHKALYFMDWAIDQNMTRFNRAWTPNKFED